MKEKKSVTTFSTGSIRDCGDGKENYVECVSWIALQRYAQYMTKSAEKYGLGNWLKGIPINSYEQSLARHWQKYLANKYNGSSLEPDVDHLAAMMFNLQGIMHEELKQKQGTTKK